MTTADAWLHVLPVDSTGRHLLTLEKARKLAILSPTSWCIGPYRSGYAIGKQTTYPEWDLYYIVDETNEPLRFDGLDAAIHFLRTQLHIHHAVLFLTPILMAAV